MSIDARAAARSAGRREIQWAWSGLLIAATVLLSGKFACAVPFAALAALGALASDRKNGLLLIGGLWLANQAIGFAFLNYPIEFDCISMGLALGISAVLGLFAARFAASALRRFNAFVGAAAALVFAFGGYEGSLYAATLLLGSSEAAYAWPIIAEVAAINAGSFAVLFCLYRTLLASGLLRRPAGLAGKGAFHGIPQTA
jgi:hypothetical protein